MVTLISTDFDTYLALRDPTTGATIEDDNGQDPNATNSEISLQLSAGTYIIYVSGLGAGTYTLVIRDFENDYYVHYKSICNKRGQSHIAVYPGPTWSPYGTPGNLNDWVAEWPTVGGDNCVGRCGKGCPGGIFFECEDLFRYTQDCFNHDVCVKTFSIGAPQCMYIFNDTAEDCWAAPDCGGPYHIDPYLGSCDGKTPCYSTIQEAINAANSGTTIKIRSGSFDEDLSLSTSKNLILKGGLGATYHSQTSDTTINSLTINNGKIIVDKVVIR